MATYTQVPGELNIEVGLGDDLALQIIFNTSLLGYTFEANVVQDQTWIEYPIIVSGSGASGVSLFLTETEIETSIQVGKHDWYLVWTTSGISRRALAGYFEVKKYPA